MTFNFSNLIELIGWAVGAVWLVGFGMLFVELVDMASEAIDKRRARK